MKRFEWRLQRVLGIKQKQEQVKRAELATITEQLSQARDELFTQRQILDELIDCLSEAGDAEWMNQRAFFMAHSAVNDAKIKKLEKRIQDLIVGQKERIAEIMELKQFNERLEKLRTEAEIEFFKEQENLEQKAMDEAVTSRFARQIMAPKGEVVS